MLNTFHDLRLRFYNPELDHISLEYINHIDQESAEFIHQQQDKKAEFTRRKGDDLEWLINNPWIISAPIEDSLAERYHFTAVETLFDFTTLKVRHKEGYLIAFMIMTRRNGHLKLPYLYYRKGLISEVIRILVFHIAKWRINMFTTFHPQLVSALWEVRSPAWYKRAQHRDYIISRFFRDEVNGQTGIEFQDGDADNAFT